MISTSRSGLLLVVAAAALSVSPKAHAQAYETATRDIGFGVFGDISRVNTDYGQTNYGYSVGLDSTRHMRHFSLFDPGLEVRFGLAPGAVVSERTMFIGPRLEHRVGRAHLYADALIGRGTLNYARTSTSGMAYALGGGLQYDLAPRWSLRFDYTQESWKLPTETNRLTPGKISIGVVWRFNVGKKSPL